jgi:hypothetical protein
MPSPSKSDSEVRDSASLKSESSLSDNDPDAVEGSYSCFRGDDGRLFLFKKAGTNDGNIPVLIPREIG